MGKVMNPIHKQHYSEANTGRLIPFCDMYGFDFMCTNKATSVIPGWSLIQAVYIYIHHYTIIRLMD